MINYDILVDTKKVARQTLGTGEFMMAKCDTGKFLITGEFVLNLTAEQFFSVKCKLELPEIGVWYIRKKGGLERSSREADLENWECRYNEWISEVSKEKLAYTWIDIRGGEIYTNGITYVAIAGERRAMLDYSEDIRLSGKMIVIDGMQVITPMKDNIWRNNGFLHRLPGMDLEREAEDEK